MLESGMPFHSLSRGNKRWGKLATFITKYQLLMRQVESGAAFQVSLEEDVVLEPGFCAFVQSANALAMFTCVPSPLW